MCPHFWSLLIQDFKFHLTFGRIMNLTKSLLLAKFTALYIHTEICISRMWGERVEQKKEEEQKEEKKKKEKKNV